VEVTHVSVSLRDEGVAWVSGASIAGKQGKGQGVGCCPGEESMKERIDRHKDGSIKAKATSVTTCPGDIGSGSEKTEAVMRSGYFENGSKRASRPPVTPQEKSSKSGR
jgi:hypothetical protein